jgi:hypothetical protein
VNDPRPPRYFLAGCECGREECHEQVPLTWDEADRFIGVAPVWVVAPGHQTSRDEIVEVCDRFLVVRAIDHTNPPTQ